MTASKTTDGPGSTVFGLQEHLNGDFVNGPVFSRRTVSTAAPDVTNDGVLLIFVCSGTGECVVNGRSFALSERSLIMIEPLQRYRIIPDGNGVLRINEFFCPYIGALYIMSCPSIHGHNMYLSHTATVITLDAESAGIIREDFDEAMLLSGSEFMMDKMRTFYFMEVLGIFCTEAYRQQRRGCLRGDGIFC